MDFAQMMNDTSRINKEKKKNYFCGTIFYEWPTLLHQLHGCCNCHLKLCEPKFVIITVNRMDIGSMEISLATGQNKKKREINLKP